MNTRRFARYEADVPLIASIFGDREVGIVRGHCDVISEGGLGAAMCGPIDIGYVVSLELHVPNSPECVRLRAMVRNRNLAKYGFEFVDLLEQERRLVGRYCRLQARLSAIKKLLG